MSTSPGSSLGGSRRPVAPGDSKLMPLGRLDQTIAVSVVYVAALFMAIMESTIVNVALPTLGAPV